MTPYWNDFAAFLAMGGYGPYVWPSLGLTALILLLEPLLLARRRRQLLHQLRRRQRIDAAQQPHSLAEATAP
jgi:heme exporter protein D